MLHSLLLLAPLAVPTPADQLDHAVLAQSFLESFGLEGTAPADLPLPKLLEERFVHARAGLFDLRIPAADLAEKRRSEEFISLVHAVLATQRGWLEWMGDDAAGGEALLDDIDIVEKEFKRFKADHLVDASKGEERDFFAIVGPSEDGLEALERLATAMGTGAPLGLGREDEPAQLVVFPKRKQFVEFIAYVGWSDDTKRPYYWVDGTEVWTECFVDSTRATCLEFPAIQRGDYTKGLRMNEKNPLEMEEQLSQIAGMALFENYYGARLPGALIGGLSNNLVIHVYGEVDTRLDGSVEGKETQGRSVFIPGGRSEGGLLPKNSAENRWRENAGRYYFLRALKKSQKAGRSDNKSTKHKYKSFQLVSDSGSEKAVTTAPVFGTPSVGSPDPPASVAQDYVEFLRAYKSGFLHWLRTESEGKRDSPKMFSSFLLKLAQGEPRDFEEAVKEHWGVPLSSAEVDEHDLEGRFIKFVSK